MTIEAFRISAGYEPDKLVVVDQTVRIKQGKINVIIGKNGCRQVDSDEDSVQAA